MANPIPYSQLFDIDGLKLAIKEAETASDEFGAAVTQDFQRTQGAAAALKKELAEINALMNGKTIRLTDDAGQQQIVQYATEVTRLTTQIKSQQKQIDAMTASLTQNKQVISDAKAAQAQYTAELAKGKADQQATRNEIASTTLELKKLALANREAALSAKERSDLEREAAAAARKANAEFPEADSKNPYRLQNPYITQEPEKPSVRYEPIITGNENMTISAKKAGAAIAEEIGILDGLRITLKELKAENLTIVDPAMLSKSNARIQELEAEIARFGNIGKVGFDKTGVAIKDFNKNLEDASKGGIANVGSGLSKGLGYVRQLAYILPGIGMAGIFNLAFEALSGLLSKMNLFSTSIKQVALVQMQLKNAMEQGNKAGNDEVVRLNILYAATQNHTLSLRDRNKAYDELESKYPQFFTNAEREKTLLGENTKAYTDLANAIMATAYAKAAESEISKNAAVIFQNDIKLKDLDKQREEAYAKLTKIKADAALLTNVRNTNSDAIGTNRLTGQQAEAQGEYNNALGQTTSLLLKNKELESVNNELKKMATEYEQKANFKTNNQLDDKNKKLKEQKDGFALLEQQLHKTLLLLQDSIIQDSKNNFGRSTEHTIALASAYNKAYDALERLKGAQAQAEINARFGKNGKAPVLTASGTNPSISDESAGLGTALTHAALEKELSDTLAFQKTIEDAFKATNKKIFKAYQDRKITLDEYNLQIKIAQESQADDRYDADLKEANIRLQLAEMEHGKASKEYESALEKITHLEERHNADSLTRDERLLAAKLKLQQEFIAQVEKGADVLGRYTGNAGLASLFKDAGSAAITGISKADEFKQVAQIAIDATEAYTEYAVKASERRQAALEREMQYEVEGAGNNKEARLRIEAEYNKRIRDEKRKQAQAQRTASIIEIIINTATAVSKTLAEGGYSAISLATAIGALGAVELGVVLAQPLPQFAGGREDGPATFAEVNERGPEALVKGNRVRFANKGKRGVTFLERNEKVITADQTAQLLNRQIAYANDSADNVSQSRMIYDKYISSTTSHGSLDYDKMAAANADAISKLPFEQNVLDERGFSRYIITKNARIKSVRERNGL